MKRLLVSATFLSLLLTHGETLKAQSQTPEFVPFKVSEVYIPKGFDDNDNLQVVIEGFFPNGCYKTAPATFSLGEDGTFHIQANAYQYYGFCIQMIVPFHQVVDLGIHKANTYKVIAEGVPTSKSIQVDPSTNNGPDDFLYAPVRQIYISKDPKQPNRRRILLSGEFTLSCMKLDHVKIPRNKNDSVIVVQPIAVMDESVKCENQMKQFEVSELLPELEQGRYLVHVRTQDGSSLNRIIQLNSM